MHPLQEFLQNCFNRFFYCGKSHTIYFSTQEYVKFDILTLVFIQFQYQFSCTTLFQFSSLLFRQRTSIPIVNRRFYSLSTHIVKRQKNWYYLKRVHKNIIYVMCFLFDNFNRLKQNQLTSFDALLSTAICVSSVVFEMNFCID